MMKTVWIAVATAPLMLLAAPATARTDQPADADTRAWWKITTALSNDAMDGRDTGSAGYDRAAQMVADSFKRAGLTPLGDNGGWFQQVPMDEIAVDSATLSVGGRPLTFLHDVVMSVTDGMPASVDGGLVYGGYCAASTLGDVRGRIVICHGTHRAGLPTAAQREAAVKAAGGIGIMTIADPGFAIEPPRWPYAYARKVAVTGSKVDTDPFLRLTLRAESLAKAIGEGHDAVDLITRGSAGEPLPTFAVADPLHAAFTLKRRHFTSANVLAMLPGTDPAMGDQAIILSAHLDGYGHGEAVNGDGLYNGTLDDAAYVALMIRLADVRKGKGYRRPIIFAAFTGEEKGLLGANWFVDHPTIAKARIAADINLDQLRPIFPLDLLTVHALDDTSLGDDVRAVTGAMGIAVQKDPEPERNLLRRADQWPFLQAGIPATAFVFGYRPGTESERIYRRWYQTGYHRPQDDVDQLMDWKAAADFNRFFYGLVARVADKDTPPMWKPGSTLKPATP